MHSPLPIVNLGDGREGARDRDVTRRRTSQG